MTKALLTLLVAPAAVLSFTATPPPLYRTPAPLRAALHPRAASGGSHVSAPPMTTTTTMMALPGREAADASSASPGKIRRVINFFKSPFTRNKETGKLETPQVDVAPQPVTESLGEDSFDLLTSGDDDLMASLRKRVNEIPEDGEAVEAAEDKPAPKLYDRRRQKAAPGGVAGTVLERPTGSTKGASSTKGSTGMKKGPREHKPTGRLAKDGASKPKAPTAKKTGGAAGAGGAGADLLDMDSVASNGPVPTEGGAGGAGGDEGPAMASAADVERLNKLFGMGASSSDE